VKQYKIWVEVSVEESEDGDDDYKEVYKESNGVSPWMACKKRAAMEAACQLHTDLEDSLETINL
jgi:hypothetical protein